MPRGRSCEEETFEREQSQDGRQQQSFQWSLAENAIPDVDVDPVVPIKVVVISEAHVKRGANEVMKILINQSEKLSSC